MVCPLQEKVLVLNKGFHPSYIVDVKEAIRLLVNCKAQIVDQEYRCYNLLEWLKYSKSIKEKTIRTPTNKFAIPEVIRLLEFDKRIKYKTGYTRENIFTRDNFQCQYCGIKLNNKTATIDHVIPRSRQIEFCLTIDQVNGWDNVTTSCLKCNSKKGSLTLEEARMKLINVPFRPGWIGKVKGVDGFYKKNIKQSWQIHLQYLTKMKGWASEESKVCSL